MKRHLVLIGVLSGCVSMNAFAQQTQRAVSVVPIQSVSNTTWHLTGTVQPRYTLPLSFRVGGKVIFRPVQVGDQIKKGQVLAQLDSADLKLALVQAQAKLGAAQADAKNATRERKRLTRIYTNKLVSQQNLQRAQTNELSTQKSVVAAQASLTLAQRQLNYSTLKSPAAGVVTQVNFEAGQVLKAGQVVIKLATGNREAVVALPTQRLNLPIKQAVAKGVMVKSHCLAELRTRSPIASSGSLDYTAFYSLKQCSAPLPLGATVSLEYTRPAETRLQKVPISAISHVQNKTFIWQIEKNQVVSQPIKVMRLDAQYAYIQSNLPIGTVIVSQGVHLLVNHQAIQVIK